MPSHRCGDGKAHHYNDLLNPTSITAVSCGVGAAGDGEAATSRTASVLSYAILFSGVLTLGVAIYTVVVNYSNLPFLDGWTQIKIVANGGNPLSPAWLWQQHNEHRLVIPKLFLAADLEMFQARQIFLLTSIVVIQILHWGLLSWSMWVLGGWRGALWRTGAGLAGFCLFCPSQWQNLTWGFQVCFVLPQLLATASFVALLLYWMESQQKPDQQKPLKFLIVSVLAALGASYSLSSGNLLWPLLVVAALYLRLRIRAVLSFAITGAVSTALYLYRYVRPQDHGDPMTALRTPVTLLKYWALYFFSSWLHRNTGNWEIIALAGVGLVALLLIPALSYARTSRPFAIQLLLTMLFCAGTALITAAGRLNFGIEQARVSRYQTVALLFWCCLGLLWLEGSFASSRMRHAFLVAQVCLLLIFARGAATVRYPLIEAGERTFAQRVVTAALITGVYDPVTLSKTYGQIDMLPRAVAYMKANRLSIFSDTLSSELGKPLTSVFPLAAAGECVGFLKGGVATEEPSGPGIVLAGWAWDAKRHKPASTIVVTTDGTITGLGAVGAWLPEGRTLYPGISSRYVGFYAFVPPPRAGAAINIYAIVSDNPPAACYFDGWRQATANELGVHRMESPTAGIGGR